MNTRCWLGSCLVLAIGLWPSTQDPVRGDRPPAPPAGQEPAPAVAPHVEPVPRDDLPERFTQRDPIEGFWELRARTVGGTVAPCGRGHMAIGRRHMLVSFQAPGPDPQIDLLRAGTYLWTRTGRGETVRTTVVAGHFNDADGDVYYEPVGNTEIRVFELLDGGLRVRQQNGDSLEFIRVE